MQNTPKPDFSSDVHRAIVAVQELFDQPVTPERLKEWSDNIGDHLAMKFATGHIRWRKKLGHPLAARWADAFAVEYWWDQVEYVPPGTPASQPGPHHIPVPIYRLPTLWDGPHDEEFWRVTWTFWGSPTQPVTIEREYQTHTFVEAKLNRSVAWSVSEVPHNPVWTRVIADPLRHFIKTADIFIVPDFEVIQGANIVR